MVLIHCAHTAHTGADGGDMTISETYAFLNSVRHMEAEIIKAQLKHDELQSCLLPKAITYDKDAVQTSPSDPMLAIASQVVDLEAEIRQMKQLKAQRIVEINNAVAMLDDDTEQMILLGFYVGRLPAKKISALVHYSPSAVYKLKYRAVKHLSEKWIRNDKRSVI